MTPELGHFALILALCLALVQASLPLVGSLNGNQQWTALARRAALAQAGFVTLAFAALVQAFVSSDFSVAYVANNSNTALPLAYRITATWGGHEGSLLLWVQILALWTVAVVAFSARVPADILARVLAVMGWISVGFLAFMLFTSNPFERLLPAAAEGRDLNPLLQDVGMIVHPPLLYMGYVGFSVAFAFAVGALIGNRLDADWVRWSRPWTLVAWSFLTLGIFMGSFWAYYELGWGGWWFWDAVENASFMPWLVGTALIHSLIVTNKRAAFKNWTVLLAILAFSLSLLGTFLVRSGVLTSVHAFATDPLRGLYILVFLAIVIGGSLALYAWRAPGIGGGQRFAVFSRESLLLLNNVFLVVCAGTVLLGTLYPLIVDALGLGKISVGPPYFEAVFVPLMLPVLLLLGVGPWVPWKQARLSAIALRLRWWALAAVLATIAGVLARQTSASVAIGLLLALWMALSTLGHLVERVQAGRSGPAHLRGLLHLPRSYWGMVLAHGGIAVFVVGATLASGWSVSQDASLRVGERLSSAGWQYTFAALERVQGPNYIAARARFEAQSDGGSTILLFPERRIYTARQMPMTEAAIDRGFTRDLYVSLGEATPDGRWQVRVQHKPFVSWLWCGCLLIASGGLLAAGDRRYRAAARATTSPGTPGASTSLQSPPPANPSGPAGLPHPLSS